MIRTSLRDCCRVLRVVPTAGPPISPTRPLVALALNSFVSGTRSRFFCASHGFKRAFCATGALHWSNYIAYDLSFAIAFVLCIARLFLQQRFCTHLPHWRILYWWRCFECFVLSCDGVHCHRTERSAAVLLECKHINWYGCIWLCGWRSLHCNVQHQHKRSRRVSRNLLPC